MDVYFDDGQVCYRCHMVGWADSHHLLWQDAYKRQYIVAPNQVLGVQYHPVLARLFLASIKNRGPDGLAGRIIVPQAFDDEHGYLPFSNGLPLRPSFN